MVRLDLSVHAIMEYFSYLDNHTDWILGELQQDSNQQRLPRQDSQPFGYIGVPQNSRLLLDERP